MAIITIQINDAELAQVVADALQRAGVLTSAAVQDNTPPWNDAQPSTPQPSPQGDPWDSYSTTTPAQPAPTQQPTYNQPQAQPPAQPPQGRPASGVVTDNKGRTWTFGAPNAPKCQHGDPAAMVSAVSAKSGKPYKQWRCAHDFDDYRNKCQFSQWA